MKIGTTGSWENNYTKNKIRFWSKQVQDLVEKPGRCLLKFQKITFDKEWAWSGAQSSDEIRVESTYNHFILFPSSL